MSYPESYRYAKSHEWLAMNGETASVGITDYAQESLGDIVFVELPKVGQQLEAGRKFRLGGERQGGKRPVRARERHRDRGEREPELGAGDHQQRGERYLVDQDDGHESG